MVNTKQALGLALRQGQHVLLALFGGLPEANFFSGSAERWSPAQHLDHLTRANLPVARVLGLPRLALAAFGGTQHRPSRSFESLRADYRAALAAGGRASGRYLPDLGTRTQVQLLEDFAAVSEQLNGAFTRWGEADLDRHQLPHPLLGPLTVRELLFFTLYHNGHHSEGVRARAGVPSLGTVERSRS